MQQHSATRIRPPLISHRNLQEPSGQLEASNPWASAPNQTRFWFQSYNWHRHSLKRSGLEQSAGKTAALPAQAGRLRMFIQVAGLAEPLAALEAGIGFFTCVNTDVLLAICQGEESLAADFAGILASSLYNQDVVL